MKSPTNKQADYYLRSAKRIAQEAQTSQTSAAYDRVVRKAQEAIELYLKSLLIQQGIEPVKTHDLVSLAEHLKKPIQVSDEDLDFLSAERIPSFYGAADFIPDEVYDSNDGARCLAILKKLNLIS